MPLNDVLIGDVLKQGLLGALLIVSIIFAYYFLSWYRQEVAKNDTLQEKRITEALANYKIIAELTLVVKRLEEAFTARRR